MSSIYDRTDIYDLLEDQTHWSAYKKHWKTLLQGKNVHSFLDVSIGSGSVTLPLCELGVQLAGSDLSEEMIRKCKEKASAAGYEIELKSCDFRNLSCWEGKQFDCVASTGNSLPHVNNDDVLTALEQMNSLVKKGGYLYLDTRNWEKILNEKRRFYLYNPVFAKKCRVNLVQVWDYSSEDTITFNLLYTFEKENQIVQREIFEEKYYPIKKEMILSKLKIMVIRIFLCIVSHHISKCQNSNWLTGTVLWQKRMIKIKVLCGRNILNKAWKHFLSRRNRYWYCCH